jgi:ribonuclease J
MLANVRIASELGYLRIPPSTLVGIEELHRLPPSDGVVVTTGSQGEPLSAIARVAAAEHKQIRVSAGDIVIFSARVIPGNEKSIGRTINRLFRQGARVLTEEVAGVHVSGHASREELKLMLNLVRPTYVVPIHGEHRHLHLHAALAREVGIPGDRVLVVEDGDIVEFSPGGARVIGRAPVGRVFVDGKQIGDIGDAVLRDRLQLASDGIVVVVIAVDRHVGKLVSGPEVASRGFLGGPSSEVLLDGMKAVVSAVVEGASDEERTDWGLMEHRIRAALKRYLQKEVERRPVIVPVIVRI